MKNKIKKRKSMKNELKLEQAFYSVKEVANFFGVNYKTMQKYLNEYKVPYFCLSNSPKAKRLYTLQDIKNIALKRIRK